MRKGYSGRVRLTAASLSAAAAIAVALLAGGPAEAVAGEAESAAGGGADAAAKPKRKPKSKPRRPRKAPPRSFFGIQSFEPLSNGELEALRKARVGSNRLLVFWRLVETQPGARDWSFYDAEFARAALFGIRILPVLYGTPRHLSGGVTLPPMSPAARDGWRRFAAELAQRYGHNGSFWRSNPGLPYLPVRHWQVWNEPSSNAYWMNRPDAAQYMSLVADTSTAIRAVDRRAKIVLAGILLHRRDPTGIPMRQYLRQIYGIEGSKGLFDGVSIHPYSIHPGKVLETAQKARKVMRRHRDGDTALWITELGWSTGGVGGSARDVISFEGQARKLAKTYALLKRHREQLRLKSIVWHVLRDYPHPSNTWNFHMGLFTFQKAAKPSWSRFAHATGGKAAGIFDPPKAPPPPEPPPPPPPDDPSGPCFLLIFC